MDEKKQHDLRDDVYAPKTTVTDLEERFVGEASPATADDGGLPLVQPRPDKGVAPGQTTKSE